MAAALVAAAPGKTVIVARCPGACFMPWRDAAQAILYELMPGQESGNSLAATLFGLNNPSGRLPVSFPAAMNETWLGTSAEQYPGTDRGRGFPEVDYSEELLMGYRWYDAQGTTPQWSFGHGLSYSTFAYSSLAVAGAVSPTASATVYATVCNTAGPSGAEVAQLYIGYPAAANEPPKLLKGFQKISLGPGACGGVGFEVAAKDLWVWDVVSQTWLLVPGEYKLLVGSSSRDIRLTGALAVTSA
jgi:beta-glucosidase